MKTTFLKISAFVLLFTLIGAGCGKEEYSASFTSDDIGSLVSIFELKYGDSKEITYNGETIKLSIKSIKDDVLVNCALVDFGNNQEGPLNVRIYADVQVNDKNQTEKVASKPCGVLLYEDNGHDLQDITELINNIKSAPANQIDNSYFGDAFINLFGEGSSINNTPFRIFMAKACPQKFENTNARMEDYKFIFIVMTKK